MSNQYRGEPLDVEIEEYGQTLYQPHAHMPATSKLHHCPCGAWLWLPSDGAEVPCECGESWAQRPKGSIVNVKDEPETILGLVASLRLDEPLMATIVKRVQDVLDKRVKDMLEAQLPGVPESMHRADPGAGYLLRQLRGAWRGRGAE